MREFFTSPSYDKKRFWQFSFVVILSLFVNISLAYILRDIAGLSSILSTEFSIEFSILFSFFLNSVWTWRDVGGRDTVESLLRYHFGVVIIALFALLLLVFLIHFAHLRYIFAHCTAVFLGTFFSFIFNNVGSFSPRGSRS